MNDNRKKLAFGGNMGITAVWLVLVSICLITCGGSIMMFGLYKMGQSVGWW